jgi:hypothetical protein
MKWLGLAVALALATAYAAWWIAAAEKAAAASPFDPYRF